MSKHLKKCGCLGEFSGPLLLLTLLILAALMLAVFGCRNTSHQQGNPLFVRTVEQSFFGLHGPDGYSDSGRDEMKAIGMGLFRQTRAITWRILHDPDTLAFWDDFINSSYNQGLILVVQLRLIVDHDGDEVFSQSDIDSYREYVEFIARRYDGKVAYYVLGNEVNKHAEWKRWLTRCALSAEICWDIVRPTANLISLSLTLKQGDNPAHDVFVDEFLTMTGNRFLSHIDIHNYRGYEELRIACEALINKVGHDIRFVVGETGTATCCSQGQPFLSEKDQAIDVVRRYLGAMILPQIVTVCWSYGLSESTNFPQTSRFAHTGLIFDGVYCDRNLPEGNCSDCWCEGEAGQKKVAYTTYLRLTTFLTGALLVDKQLDRPVYQFQHSLSYHDVQFQSLTVLWSDSTPYSLEVDWRSSPLLVLNLITGVEKAVYIDQADEPFILTVDREPLMIFHQNAADWDGSSFVFRGSTVILQDSLLVESKAFFPFRSNRSPIMSNQTVGFRSNLLFHPDMVMDSNQAKHVPSPGRR